MVKKIALSRGLFALVDDDDFDQVSKFKWIATKGGKGFYAVTSHGPDGKDVSLHRFLISPGLGNEVDHRNGDGLDNRRTNLRECSHKENLRNKKKQPETTSRFKGVSITRSGAWAVQIEQNGIKLKIGTFRSEFKAARSYDTAARVLFGQFARTNESLGLFEGALDRVNKPKHAARKIADKTFAREMARLGIVPRFAA